MSTAPFPFPSPESNTESQRILIDESVGENLYGTLIAQNRESVVENNRLQNYLRSVDSLGTEFNSKVVSEAEELAEEGYDVLTVESPDIAEFNGLKIRKQIIKAVASTMVKAAGVIDPGNEKPSIFYAIPTARRWDSKRGTALAINAGVLTRRSIDGKSRKSDIFCEDIDPEIFTLPIFSKTEEGSYAIHLRGNEDSLSARDLLLEKSDKSAEAIRSIDMEIGEHEDYINGKVGPLGRLFLDGLADMEGIRTRISLGVNMVLESVKDHPKEVPLKMASLGCGSALPVIEAIKALRKEGYEIEKYHLVDTDPLALAAAVSALKNSGIEDIEDIFTIHINDLGRSGEGIKGIENGSIDVADAFGLYEYLRDRFASRFLQSCGKMLNENGKLCLTNMHTERSQQAFFKNLIRWKPVVQQRNLREMVSSLESSGFMSPKVRLGNKGSVYAGYIAQK